MKGVTGMLTAVPLELVMRAELVKILGVSNTRYAQIVSSPDFPAPVADLSGGKIWNLADIRRWAKRVGRELHLDQI